MENRKTSGLLTLEEVAEQLACSKAWVRDHCTRRSPRIPCIRLGTKRALIRVRPSDLEKFIADNLSSVEKSA